MFQTKKKKPWSGGNLKETEVSNLSGKAPDKDFQVLVVKMLTALKKEGNSTKRKYKNQR